METKVFFITGSAGFIGSNLVIRLLSSYNNIKIVGIDNLNDYYDVAIKEYRLEQIKRLIINGPFIMGIFLIKN